MVRERTLACPRRPHLEEPREVQSIGSLLSPSSTEESETRSPATSIPRRRLELTLTSLSETPSSDPLSSMSTSEEERSLLEAEVVRLLRSLGKIKGGVCS